MPKIDIKKPIELLSRLLDDLIDGEALENAVKDVDTAQRNASEFSIGHEDSVAPAFTASVALPVKYILRAFKTSAQYEGGPKNQRKETAIFEHKTPRVYTSYSEKSIELATQKGSLNLSEEIKGAGSVVAKVALASVVEGHEYCAIHSGASYLIIRLVKDPHTDRWQARISNVIHLTDEGTPVLSLVLAMLVQAKQNGSSSKSQLSQQTVPTPNNTALQQALEGKSNTTGPSPQKPGTKGDVGNTGTDVQGGRKFPLGSLSAYWEPKAVTVTALTAMLKSMSGISLMWDMKMFTDDIFYPRRRHDSTAWCDSMETKGTPRLLRILPGHNDTPPPSPPIQQFVGHSLPMVAKILPENRMDCEVEIWRTLRQLAGNGRPGLFGAYVLEDNGNTVSALIQQHTGETLQSFDGLGVQQRCELCRLVGRIHGAGVEHGDLNPSNVTTTNDGKISVIDFSHSESHECEGERNCDELESLRFDLWLHADFHLESPLITVAE
ncbi:hypothetical protein FRB90_005692 [Tulasnella sp. 427]|nr:hypothetical protein FRB90_005692 [Tulasnella sp. 427]